MRVDPPLTPYALEVPSNSTPAWQVGLRDRWISFSFDRFVFKQMRGTMTAEP